MKLAVGINTYQDRKGIQRTIESLYDNVDFIIVVDGRYPSWGTDQDPQFSIDGTKEYCSSLDKVKYYEMFADQTEKRTKYMKLSKRYDCDLLLVVDSDDYVHQSTDWNTFKEYANNVEYFRENKRERGQQIYNVEFIMTPTKRQYIGRLFYNPFELRYISHWKVVNITRNNNEVRYPRASLMNVPGLVMTSNDITRPKTRIPIDIEYQWNLLYKEGSINKERYTSPNMKRKFEQEIWNEAIVWEKYFETH